MSDGPEPGQFARDQLQQRCERLAYFLKHGAPAPIIDEAMRLVSEAVDRWYAERKAGEN